MGTNYYVVRKATPEELKVLEKFGVSRVQLHIGKKSGEKFIIRTHSKLEVISFLGDNYPELRGQIKCLKDFDRFFDHPDFEIISEYGNSTTKSFIDDSHLEYMSGEFS